MCALNSKVIRPVIHLIIPTIQIPLAVVRRILHLPHRLARLDEARVAGAGVHGGPQVEDEGEDVEGEDEGDDPFEDGGDVVLFLPGARGKGDGEAELGEDEEELDPEGDAEHAVFDVS